VKPGVGSDDEKKKKGTICQGVIWSCRGENRSDLVWAISSIKVESRPKNEEPEERRKQTGKKLGGPTIRKSENNPNIDGVYRLGFVHATWKKDVNFQRKRGRLNIGGAALPWRKGGGIEGTSGQLPSKINL